MPIWFTLIMMVLFSALPAAAAWALVQRLPQLARIIVSIVSGMTPLLVLGWMVYRSKGGNGGLDPLQFYYLMIAVSFVCALLAVFAMEWRMRRR